MKLLCPACGSSHLVKLDRARKTGAVIGAVGGTVGGVASTLSGAEVGSLVGAFAGPAGAILGGFTGALIGGLIGGASGCIAGEHLGAALDIHVLDNHLCKDCGHQFSLTTPGTTP